MEQNGTKTQQTQAIAPAPAQVPATRSPTPLAPDNLNDAWRLAEALARSTIIPKNYQGNPGNILAAIMLAQELRVTPMLIMREVFFLNDRPALYSELKIALVMREPDCEYLRCTHTDAKSATFETKRRGHTAPTVLSVKIEEIPEALRRKDTWQAWTANMLRWRCGGWICDLVYPDKVLGMKTKEEMEDSPDTRPLGTLERLPPDIQAPPAAVSEPVQVESAPVSKTETAAQNEPTKPEEKKSETSAPDDAVAREAEVKISMVFASAKSRAELKQAVSLIANHPDPNRKKHWGDQYNVKIKELAA